MINKEDMIELGYIESFEEKFFKTVLIAILTFMIFSAILGCKHNYKILETKENEKMIYCTECKKVFENVEE